METRCPWCGDDPQYKEYHDKEWGVPLYDDEKLFEMLILEGAQAGLSWITILKRREGYQQAYDGFDPEKMACWSDGKLEELMQDRRIIRNRLKVKAARQNALAYLELKKDQDSFSDFLWSFIGGKPIKNHWIDLSNVPVKTTAAEKMSSELKKKGFKFIGPTICYAFMQAVGMVNDHTTSCFRHDQI
jgi:DNA-3-methyladenine glycosylase I